MLSETEGAITYRIEIAAKAIEILAVVIIVAGGGDRRALAFALIYKVLPEVEIAWRDVLIGAMVTAVMVAVGLLVFGLYLSSGMVGSALEAAGAFAVLLIGIYTMAQIFLFGAMFTRVFAAIYGSKAGNTLTFPLFFAVFLVCDFIQIPACKQIHQVHGQFPL